MINNLDRFLLWSNLFQGFILLVLCIAALTATPKIKNLTNKLIRKSDDDNKDGVIQKQLLILSNKYASNAIIIIDVFGVILFWSRGAEVMFGRASAEIKGKKLLEIIPPKYHKEHIDGLSLYRETGITQIAGNLLDVTALKVTGEEFHIELKFFLDKTIADMDVFVAIIQDLTEIDNIKLLSKAELKEMEEYELILGVGGWHWDLATDIVTRTPGFNEIFELDDSDIVHSEDLIQRIHIDDRKQSNEIILAAYTAKKSYELKYRIKRSNEEIVHIAVKAKAVFDSHGDLNCYKGTIQKLK